MGPMLLALAAAVPPFDDELYYWCWSQNLQLSYYDHPPLVAYLIRLSTELLGQSILAIRLPAVVSGWVVIAVVGFLSRPRDLLPLVALSPVMTYGAILITPDTPLLMFWALYLAWLIAVHERLVRSTPVRGGWWLLGGLLLGCGVLGKYTMGLAALAGGASFLVMGQWRRWLGGYLVHALVAVIVASPILIHNIRHDFVPIRYQWGHSMSSPQPGFTPFAEFVGVQLLLFGTIPFVVFVWAISHSRELLAEPRLRVLAGLFVLPFAFFLLKATRGRLEGNWAYPCYLACWPLAAAWYSGVKASERWWWATRAGFALPLGVSAFFTIHLIEPMEWVPTRIDRPTRQWGKLQAAQAFAEDLKAAGYNGPVYTTTYQWTALLRWVGVDARQMDGVTRPSHFTTPPQSPLGQPKALVCTDGILPPELMPGFDPPRIVARYPVLVRGEPYQQLIWLEYSRNPAVLPVTNGDG
jgi:4-amino-4-deoxy-L-arabinose transferase-like glycosyltransferase